MREHVGDADGIVEVLPHERGAARVAIWNRDGSSAELSGNATRIAAQWLFERDDVDAVVLDVGGRVMHARRLPDGTVEQEVGEVVVGAPEVAGEITFVPVDVGNPHAVVVGDPDTVAWIGPLLERHPRFPNRTNVQVARVEAPGVVVARVWERGVGETASSGTSAVAVAAATHGDGDVLVRFPGGDLRVRLDSGRAWLVGPPATRVDEDSRSRDAHDTPA